MKVFSVLFLAICESKNVPGQFNELRFAKLQFFNQMYISCLVDQLEVKKCFATKLIIKDVRF